jgi:hypothetical protein
MASWYESSVPTHQEENKISDGQRLSFFKFKPMDLPNTKQEHCPINRDVAQHNLLYEVLLSFD